MPKCPYCKEELEIKITMKPVKIDQEFKDAILTATEELIDIQADVMPFGGGMARNMAKYSLKWIEKYLNAIGGLPVMLQSCKNCDAVINSNLFTNLGTSLGTRK